MLEDFMTAYTRWHIESRQKGSVLFRFSETASFWWGSLRPRSIAVEDGMPFEGRGRATQKQQSGLWTGKPVLVHTVCLLAGDGWPGAHQSRDGTGGVQLVVWCADVACAWMRRSWFCVIRLNIYFHSALIKVTVFSVIFLESEQIYKNIHFKLNSA